MAGKGGYQAPTNPAMVSGPGSLSARTDGGPASKQAVRAMTGGPYGENKDMADIQSQAAMEKLPDVKGASPSSVAQAVQAGNGKISRTSPLTQPSDRPWEHVTTGADNTAYQSAGSEVMPPQMGLQGQYQTAAQMFQQSASRPDASPMMKYLAQRIGQAY